MTATDRRRNMRAENCRACGTLCEAGAGYLYRDTNGVAARRRFDRSGRWGWFVKCEACHAGGKSKVQVQMERDAAARANEPPPPRAWSVSQVRGWVLERGEHDGDVALILTGGFGREVISYRDPITSRFTARCGYQLEQSDVAGRPLSPAALKELDARIIPAITAVQQDERDAGQVAADRLVAIGATVKPTTYGHYWRVDFRGGHYHLWGRVGGYKMSGQPAPGESFRDVTIEELTA